MIVCGLLIIKNPSNLWFWFITRVHYLFAILSCFDEDTVEPSLFLIDVIKILLALSFEVGMQTSLQWRNVLKHLIVNIFWSLCFCKEFLMLLKSIMSVKTLFGILFQAIMNKVCEIIRITSILGKCWRLLI